MPKIALQPLSPYIISSNSNMDLKRKLLLFDSIWINETHLNLSMRVKNSSAEISLLVNENFSSIEYLIDAGEIILYKGRTANILNNSENFLIKAKMMYKLSMVSNQINKDGGITIHNNPHYSGMTSDIFYERKPQN